MKVFKLIKIIKYLKLKKKKKKYYCEDYLKYKIPPDWHFGKNF